jgi:hypothetical protein
MSRLSPLIYIHISIVLIITLVPATAGVVLRFIQIQIWPHESHNLEGLVMKLEYVSVLAFYTQSLISQRYCISALMTK